MYYQFEMLKFDPKTEIWANIPAKIGERHCTLEQCQNEMRDTVAKMESSEYVATLNRISRNDREDLVLVEKKSGKLKIYKFIIKEKQDNA